MNISAGTIVPPSVVLAVAGWSCWTILGAATPPAAKPKPVESASALLVPELGAATERDPFMLPGEPEPVAKGVGGPAKPVETPAARLRRMMAELNARLASARAAEAKKAAARERLAQMPLAATSVHRDRRTAIIGGRAYAEGETIEGTDASLGAVVLAEVRAKEATLRSSAGLVTVKFADTSARSSSAPPPPPAAAADAAPRRSRAAGASRSIRGKAR